MDWFIILFIYTSLVVRCGTKATWISHSPEHKLNPGTEVPVDSLTTWPQLLYYHTNLYSLDGKKRPIIRSFLCNLLLGGWRDVIGWSGAWAPVMRCCKHMHPVSHMSICCRFLQPSWLIASLDYPVITYLGQLGFASHSLLFLTANMQL